MRDRLGLSAAQSLMLMVLGTLIGGVSGLVAILVCHYLLNFGGVDIAQKHGISQVDATRIGGVMIAVYLVLNLGFQAMVLDIQVLNDDSTRVLLAALPFLVIGFYEDWRGILTARFRFVTMMLFALGVVTIESIFIIQPVGVYLLDLFLAPGWLAALITILCLAFLPNAFNTADGANGLVSGISLIVALALGVSGPELLKGFYYSVVVACLLFLIYNLFTGRFFLGDGGAYFLGALVAIGIVLAANAALVSVFYWLALISYPVIDLLFSMARRRLVGRSPFAADNEHLHNLLFALLNRSPAYGVQANTLVGLSIAIVFAFMPFLLHFFGLIQTAGVWLFIYLTQWLVYVGLWYWLAKRICVLDPVTR